MFVGIITLPSSSRQGSACPGRNASFFVSAALFRLWHLDHYHGSDARRARWDRAPLGAGHVVLVGSATAGAAGGILLMLE